METIKKEELEKLEAEVEWLMEGGVDLGKFGSLHPREKEAIANHVLAGKSYNEAAAAMGLTSLRVKQLCAQGISKIKKEVIEAIRDYPTRVEFAEDIKALRQKYEHMEKLIAGITTGVKEPVPEIRIHNIKGLSERAKNILTDAAILNLEDLKSYNRRDLLRLRNMGKKTLNEIIAAALEHNVVL